MITHGHEDHIGSTSVCAAGVEYSDLCDQTDDGTD